MTEPSPQDEGAREPTPEEFAAALVHRLGRIPVRDVLLQTSATLSDMAGIRMGLGPEGPAVRDLAQARHAIEALRALVGVLEQEFGAAQARPFKEPLAQLQLMYAQISEAPQGEPEGDEAAGDPPPPPPPPPAAGPDPSSKLWVPPHHRKGQ